MKNVSLVERVCESFYADSLSAALKSVENLQNIGELRFDLCDLNPDDIAKLKKATEKELIFTCRTEKLSKANAANAYHRLFYGWRFAPTTPFTGKNQIDFILSQL